MTVIPVTREEYHAAALFLSARDWMQLPEGTYAHIHAVCEDVRALEVIHRMARMRDKPATVTERYHRERMAEWLPDASAAELAAFHTLCIITLRYIRTRTLQRHRDGFATAGELRAELRAEMRSSFRVGHMGVLDYLTDNGFVIDNGDGTYRTYGEPLQCAHRIDASSYVGLPADVTRRRDSRISTTEYPTATTPTTTKKGN